MIEHPARLGDVLRRALACAVWRAVNGTPLPVVCFTRSGLAPRPKSWPPLYRRQIASRVSEMRAL